MEHRLVCIHLFCVVSLLVTIKRVSSGINIATTGTASQSSNYQDTDPNRSIDGNTESTWSSNSCSHTNNDQNAWWKVDLGKSYVIYEVIVTNRQDCCSERLLNAEVRVGNSDNIGENIRCGELVGSDRVNDETLTFQCNGPVTGRYVSVQLVDRQSVLNICEVQVMVPKHIDGINIATTGTASQSSNYQDTDPNRSIDGNTESTWSSNSCSHTKNDQNAWWKVDLRKSYHVYEVIVTNRQDCCSERLLNAEVRVGNSENIGENIRCGELVGSDRVNDETLTFQCNGVVTGRYVSVQLVDRQSVLNICEVQVMVPKDIYAINIATTGTASQSSNHQDTDPNRSIDGNTESTWSSNSCSHTKNDQNAWWKVDLGKPYHVYEVIVTNRQDCCSERLLNAEVRVGNSDDIGENIRCGELVGSDRVNDETLTFQCNGPVTGRYVSVQLVDRQSVLNICEVQVMVPKHIDGINIATTGTASQSSNYQDTDPNRSIDGNTESTWSSNSCSHTKNDQNAWWKVDLRKSYHVYEVIVTNRQDCCSERILNAEVRVGNSENIGENIRCGELVGSDRVNDETLTFQCNGLVSGRYASVQLVDRQSVLNICEVQVMVPKDIYAINIATTGTASQSSNHQDTDPNRSIDGNTESTWSSNSCSHTKNDQNAWWKVDLGKSYHVYEVIVTNRQDCCSERLLNAEVRVGNSDDIGENIRCGELVGSDRVNDETLTFQCNGVVSGRYVSVQLVGRQDALNICEVQVMVPKRINDPTVMATQHIVSTTDLSPESTSTTVTGYGFSFTKTTKEVSTTQQAGSGLGASTKTGSNIGAVIGGVIAVVIAVVVVIAIIILMLKRRANKRTNRGEFTHADEDKNNLNLKKISNRYISNNLTDLQYEDLDLDNVNTNRAKGKKSSEVDSGVSSPMLYVNQSSLDGPHDYYNVGSSKQNQPMVKSVGKQEEVACKRGDSVPKYYNVVESHNKTPDNLDEAYTPLEKQPEPKYEQLSQQRPDSLVYEEVKYT